MKKTMRSVLVVVLALTLLVGTMSTALASGYTVSNASGNMVAVQAVNVRTGPLSSYAKLGWLTKGAIVVRTGIASNGWVQIDLGSGLIGYVSGSYLIDTATTTTVTIGFTPTTGVGSITTGTQLYAITSLNVRMGAGTRYERITWLKQNEVVTQIGTKGNWAKIRTAAGVEGYASLAYLRVYTGPVPTSAPVPQPTIPVVTYFYTSYPVNLFAGPGSNYYLVGNLDKGVRVTVYSYSGSWAKVGYGNQIGYVYSAYLTNIQPQSALLTTNASNKEIEIANYINNYRYNSSSNYNFRYLQSFYTMQASVNYVISNYYFNGSNYLELVYSPLDSSVNTISFRWYRSPNGYALLNGLFPLNGLNTNYTTQTLGGTVYYFDKPNPSTGYQNIYWLENGYLFYASVPSYFTYNQISSLCHGRLLTFANNYSY